MNNALITGATKGMGRAIAIAFAKQGVNLAICSRSANDLSSFKTELLQINADIKVFTAVADGSKKNELLQFAVAAESELGFISVLINSLGTYKYASILDEVDGDFETMLNTNLMPAYELYRFFGKKMIAKGSGHIFNICSVAALDVIPQAGSYSVSKAALLSLTNVMRLEMQPHGIKVTAVIPGSTFTNSWKGMDVDQDSMVQPEDIASAIINIYTMSTGANVDEIIIKPVKGQL
ncbi:MAG: SDR family oxidoreductase [Mucilaginibacter sp.]